MNGMNMGKKLDVALPLKKMGDLNSVSKPQEKKHCKNCGKEAHPGKC